MQTRLKQKYEQYVQDEKTLAVLKREAKVRRMKVFSSVLFELHYVLLTWGVVKLVQLVMSLETNPDIGSVILGIFLGAVELGWIVGGNIGVWFDVTSDSSALLQSLATSYKLFLESQERKQQLTHEARARREFLQFYELYTSDAHFQEEYDRQMLSNSQTISKEFMKRLTEN